MRVLNTRKIRTLTENNTIFIYKQAKKKEEKEQCYLLQLLTVLFTANFIQGSSDFSLVSKVPQVKNRLFPTKHLPLCKPLRFAS